MCIAILKPIGANITDEELNNSFNSNRQGGGYSFVGKKGRMVVRKGFFDFVSFLEAYRADEKRWGENSPALIHFRIATGSKVNEENCHPFEFKHGTFIHNGWFFSSTLEKSDTNIFVEKVGDWLTKDRAVAHKEELGKHFGYNKVVILYRDRTALILNESSGQWHNGVWYSNGGFRNNSVGFRPGPNGTNATVQTAPACGVGVAFRREASPLGDEEEFDDSDFDLSHITGGRPMFYGD